MSLTYRGMCIYDKVNRSITTEELELRLSKEINRYGKN